MKKNAKDTDYRVRVWVKDKNTNKRYYVVNSISKDGKFISGSLFLTTVKSLTKPEPIRYNAIKPNTNHVRVPLAEYIFTSYAKISAKFFVEALCENNQSIKCNVARPPIEDADFFSSVLILYKENRCEDPEIITDTLNNKCRFIYRYGWCTGFKNVECASSNFIKFTGVGREEKGFIEVYDDCFTKPIAIKDPDE